MPFIGDASSMRVMQGKDGVRCMPAQEQDRNWKEFPQHFVAQVSFPTSVRLSALTMCKCMVNLYELCVWKFSALVPPVFS
jgi:hypothetical protein